MKSRIYALVRVGKVKAMVRLGARSNKGLPPQQIEDCADHELRLKPTPNADPEKWELNRLLIGEEDRVQNLSFEDARAAGLLRRELFRDSVNRKLTGVGIDPAGVRTDAVLAQQVLLSASPSYFEQASDRESALEKWWEATVAFAQKRFGRCLMLGVGHLDEHTPHIGWLVIPLVQKDLMQVGRGNKAVSTGVTAWRLSAFDLFGPRQIENLWTEYAAAMAPLGLERPPKGIRAHYTTVGEFYSAIEDAKATGSRFVADIRFEMDPVQKRLLGSESAEEYRKRNQAALDAYLAQLREHVRHLHFQATRAQLLDEKESFLRRGLEKKDEQLAKAIRERDAHLHERNVTTERYRAIALSEFIEELSLPKRVLDGVEFFELPDRRLLRVLTEDEFAIIDGGDPLNVVDSGRGVVDLLGSILHVDHRKALDVAMQLWGPKCAGSVFAWWQTHVGERNPDAMVGLKRRLLPANQPTEKRDVVQLDPACARDSGDVRDRDA